jgi:hypothetical protein
MRHWEQLEFIFDMPEGGRFSIDEQLRVELVPHDANMCFFIKKGWCDDEVVQKCEPVREFTPIILLYVEICEYSCVA